jgi:hypothetical protein
MGDRILSESNILSPLRGLRWQRCNPRLTPWAIFGRCYAAILKEKPNSTGISICLYLLRRPANLKQGIQMKGRQKGRPIKWVSANVREPLSIGKRGVEFEIWDKWSKKSQRKLGTLTINVGGLRWRPCNGKLSKKMSWDDLSEHFTPTAD